MASLVVYPAQFQGGCIPDAGSISTWVTNYTRWGSILASVSSDNEKAVLEFTEALTDEQRGEILATLATASDRVAVPRTADGTPYSANQELTLGREPFVRSDDGSTVMNVDGNGAGSPVLVWNGTGVDDTGADWTSSGTGSEDAASKHSGTNGWNTGVTAQNDYTVLNNGSLVDVDGSYDELQFWLQVKAYPPGSRFRLRWVDGSDNPVGNTVLVSDYVSGTDFDTWYLVSIPIADFNLTSDVQKLQLLYLNTSGQHFWFDDFALVASSGGGPYRFVIEAPADQRWHLSMAVLLLSAPVSGWVSTAFCNIPSGLAKGLVFRHRRKSTGDVLSKFVVRNNLQLFGQYHPQEDATFADDVLLWGFMVKPGKATVIITDDDVLEFVVRDDLSLISEMRAFCHYGVEEVV